FSQGLQLRQIDMLQDGVAGSSRTLSKMSYKLRKGEIWSYLEEEKMGLRNAGNQRKKEKTHPQAEQSLSQVQQRLLWQQQV
ncbi:unnamed protein product, partial [Gadus morhua 'NCC']